MDDNFFKGRKKSFSNAYNGIIYVLRNEVNLKIHFVITFLVILIGFILEISNFEWLVVFLIIALVLSLEVVNSAIEKVSDIVTRKYSNEIRIIKDISAGAVLISAIVALIIGFIVFLPKIMVLI